MAYTNPNFQNNSSPAINATNLNNLANAVELLGVENGGTGKESITSGALVVGNGTDAVEEVIGSGALYSETTGNPEYGTLPVSCGGTGVVTLEALKEALSVNPYIASATAPSDTTKLWIDTTNNTMKYYNGSGWIAVCGVYAAIS